VQFFELQPFWITGRSLCEGGDLLFHPRDIRVQLEGNKYIHEKSEEEERKGYPVLNRCSHSNKEQKYYQRQERGNKGKREIIGKELPYDFPGSVPRERGEYDRRDKERKHRHAPNPEGKQEMVKSKSNSHFPIPIT